MIMTVKTPGSQMGSPAAAEGGREAMGGGSGRVRVEREESASEVDIDVDGAKSEIKVERSCDPGWSAEDFAESIIENTVVGIVVIDMGHHSARTNIGMPVDNGSFVPEREKSLL